MTLDYQDKDLLLKALRCYERELRADMNEYLLSEEPHRTLYWEIVRTTKLRKVLERRDDNE